MTFAGLTLIVALVVLAGLVAVLALELRRERRDVEQDRARLARVVVGRQADDG